LGGPLEFVRAEEIREQFGCVTTMLGGGWLHLCPGETTDDTAMTLAVAEGIMEQPDDPIPAIGERFISWADGRAVAEGGHGYRPCQAWPRRRQRSPYAGRLPRPLLP